MPSIYDLKPKFQALLRPLCSALARIGVTANQVTIAAFLLSVAHGVWHALTTAALALWFLPVVLFIRMALNAIDGMLAREHDQQSKLGALLNELTDVLSDAVLFLPFALIVGLSPSLVVIAILLGVIAEMTGVLAVSIGAMRRYDGPFGKSDRAAFFGLLAVLLAAGLDPGLWSDIYLALGGCLGAVTIINRARCALKETENGNA